MPRQPTLLLLLALAGCASAPPPVAAPPPEPKPLHFVEDPIDLLPELQGVVHINVRRLREEPQIFERLLERGLASTDDPEDAEQLRFLADHTESVLFGISRVSGEDPDFVLVVRTRDRKLVDAAGVTLGTQTEVGPLGFRRAKLGEDDLVLTDDYTAILYEPGLKTSIEAILSKRPGRRLRQGAVYEGLAQDVAFGSAPVSLLGTLPPEVVGKVTERAPPALLPLARALGSVHSYGGQIDISERVDLRLFAQGGGSAPVGVLAGAILMMKNALANSGDDPLVAKLARDLRVEVRDNVLELSYSLARAQLLEMLDEWGKSADKGAEPEAPPTGKSEI